MSALTPHLASLHRDLATLIGHSRQRLAVSVNCELTQLYWSIGHRINQEVLGGQRGTYGAKVIDQLGAQLAQEFGRGFEAKNLRRMVEFSHLFPDASIVATLSRQLAWSHFKEIFPLKDPQARAYYAGKSAEEQGSVRELRKRIEAKTWERSALATLRQGQEPENHPTSPGPLPCLPHPRSGGVLTAVFPPWRSHTFPCLDVRSTVDCGNPVAAVRHRDPVAASNVPPAFPASPQVGRSRRERRSEIHPVNVPANAGDHPGLPRPRRRAAPGPLPRLPRPRSGGILTAVFPPRRSHTPPAFPHVPQPPRTTEPTRQNNDE